METPQSIQVLASSIPLDLNKDIYAQIAKAKATLHGKFVGTIEDALLLEAKWDKEYKGYYIYTMY